MSSDRIKCIVFILIYGLRSAWCDSDEIYGNSFTLSHIEKWVWLFIISRKMWFSWRAAWIHQQSEMKRILIIKYFEYPGKIYRDFDKKIFCPGISTLSVPLFSRKLPWNANKFSLFSRISKILFSRDFEKYSPFYHFFSMGPKLNNFYHL